MNTAIPQTNSSTTESEFQYEYEGLVLTEYSESELHTLIETGMTTCYPNVYPLPDLTNDSPIASRPWDDTPSYSHNPTTNETLYTSRYVNHTLTTKLTRDASGVMIINFTITPCPITDLYESIRDEYYKIVHKVIVPVRANTASHGEYCQALFTEQQEEFACDRVNYL